jgi:hypothetical protein
VINTIAVAQAPVKPHNAFATSERRNALLFPIARCLKSCGNMRRVSSCRKSRQAPRLKGGAPEHQSLGPSGPSGVPTAAELVRQQRSQLCALYAGVML